MPSLEPSAYLCICDRGAFGWVRPGLGSQATELGGWLLAGRGGGRGRQRNANGRARPARNRADGSADDTHRDRPFARGIPGRGGPIGRGSACGCHADEDVSPPRLPPNHPSPDSRGIPDIRHDGTSRVGRPGHTGMPGTGHPGLHGNPGFEAALQGVVCDPTLPRLVPHRRSRIGWKRTRDFRTQLTGSVMPASPATLAPSRSPAGESRYPGPRTRRPPHCPFKFSRSCGRR